MIVYNSSNLLKRRGKRIVSSERTSQKERSICHIVGQQVTTQRFIYYVKYHDKNIPKFVYLHRIFKEGLCCNKFYSNYDNMDILAVMESYCLCTVNHINKFLP